MMPKYSVYQWIVGLTVSLLVGTIVTRIFLRWVRRLIDYNEPTYKTVPPWILGVVEGTFFTVVVAFDIQGAAISMIAWMTAKMAAHWNSQLPNGAQSNLAAVRFSSLLGSMVSLFFAMIGGLICKGTIWL